MSRGPELTLPDLQVAAGILCDPRGLVLITDRSRAAEMQEYWEFPGGKLTPGESPSSALCRELHEELGIDLCRSEHFMQLDHAYSDFRVSIDFFLVTAWDGVPSGMEGQALRWIDPRHEVAELLLPADAPVLASLAATSLVAQRRPPA